MNIYLCYIPGISRIDTPMFGNSTPQHLLFHDNCVLTIETSYYPPHYRNKIRVELKNETLTTKVNYLMFSYGTNQYSKYYYYFIDDITYINESCIELDITMDVIQTFYRDIRVISGCIERKFINRYEQYTVGASTKWRINRHYIRENVSEGLYQVGKKNYFDYSYNVVVIKATGDIQEGITEWYLPSRQLTSSERIRNKIYGVSSNLTNQKSFSNCRYYFIPLLDKPVLKMGFDGGHQQGYLPDYFNLDDILSNPKVVDAFLLPLEYFAKYFEAVPYTDTAGNQGYNIVFSDEIGLWESFRLLASGNFVPVISFFTDADYVGRNVEITTPIDYYDAKLTIYSNVRRKIDINIDFAKSIYTTNTFNTKYMTQLYDENYIMLVYGTPSVNSSYPLYYRTDTLLRLYEQPSILSNDVLYYITYLYYPSPSSVVSQENLFNNYGEYIVYNSPCNIEFTNDPYKEYVANNRGRWLSAVTSTTVSAFETLLGIQSAGRTRKTALENLWLNPRSLTPIRRQPTYSTLRRNRNIETQYANEITSELGNIGGMVSPLINQGIKDYNMTVAPKSVKQSGNSESMILSLETLGYYQLNYVLDYEQCGQYFHRNGFRVDEYVSAVSNIFGYVNNRYYFNILKMSEVELELNNYINSQEIIEEIKNRLIAGLRLWKTVYSAGHVSFVTPIGTYTYDNVENDFIS